MKAKIGLVILLLCTASGLAVGWWPEHRQRVVLQEQLTQLRSQLGASESSTHVCELQNRLLSLLDLVHANNYSAAQSASSAFFDAVRAEKMRATGAAELDKILAQRDAVTVALSRSDSTVEDALRAIRASLMQLQAAAPRERAPTQ
jgi:hypothetical protein